MPSKSTSDAGAAPLVVGSRTRSVLGFTAIGAGLALAMFLVRRADLDFEEWLITAALLVFACWLCVQSIGILWRRLSAGHAMRIDDAGLHLPGWDPVPWSSLRGVQFVPRKPSKRFGVDRLYLDLDPACIAHRRGDYTRWLFGPIEGLWGRAGKPVDVPLVAMDTDGATIAEALRRRIPTPRRPT